MILSLACGCNFRTIESNWINTMVAEQVSSAVSCLCGVLDAISSLHCIAKCWRLVVSLILYLGYVYAAFVAMAFLAYNAFTEKNTPIRFVTVAVAALFLLLGIVIVTLLEWIWKPYWLPAHQQQGDLGIPYYQQQPVIRLLLSLMVWGVCFYVSTYILWWLGEHNSDNNISVAIMWILLFTLVPTMDLLNSRLVYRAIPWPHCWKCCRIRSDADDSADSAESDGQMAESLVRWRLRIIAQQPFPCSIIHKGDFIHAYYLYTRKEEKSKLGKWLVRCDLIGECQLDLVLQVQLHNNNNRECTLIVQVSPIRFLKKSTWRQYNECLANFLKSKLTNKVS